jgi:hypothetical protein
MTQWMFFTVTAVIFVHAATTVQWGSLLQERSKKNGKRELGRHAASDMKNSQFDACRNLFYLSVYFFIFIFHCLFYVLQRVNCPLRFSFFLKLLLPIFTVYT